MSNYAGIKNHEAVLKQFGCWPSFHDAEILSILLDRKKGEGLCGPTATIKIHAFIMTDEVDEHGYCKTINHAVVAFYFTDVVQFELKYGFGNQKSMSSLWVEDIRKDQMENIDFSVSIGTTSNAEVGFRCSGIEVLSVEPGIPEDSAYA